MVPIGDVNPAQPAQSGAESEDGAIRDDESIEILGGPPPRGTAIFLHLSESIFSGEEEEESDGTDLSGSETKTGQSTSHSDVRTDPEESKGTNTATVEGSEDFAEDVGKLTHNQEKEVSNNDVENQGEVESRNYQQQEDSEVNNITPISSPKQADNYPVVEGLPSMKGNYEDRTFEAEGAVRQIISGIGEKLDDNQEVVKLDPQLEAVQTDAATPRSTDAQDQDKVDKFRPEDSRLQNEHLVTSIPITAKVPELNIENGILLKCLDEIAICRNSQQYIKQKARISNRIDQLGFSARLNFCNLDIKLHNEGCLMTANNNFLARVRILDTEIVALANDFATAKKVLLEQLEIVHVFQDDLMSEKVVQEKSVIQVVQTASEDSLRNGKPAVDIIQLTYMINTHDKLDFVKLCEEIKNNYLVSQELRQTVELFLLAEARCIIRGNILARFGHRQPATNNDLKSMLNEYVEAYRKQLLEKAPICLSETLSNISNDRIITVQSSDIKLFSDLMGVLDGKMFQKPLADLVARWTDHVGKINIENFPSIEPQINPVFYFLAKSLEDLIIEICNRTNHTVEELLISDHSGWQPIKKIIWNSENVLTKCLEREYFFILKLLKHFDLGSCNENKPFEYDVKLFEGPKQRSIWNQLVKNTKRLFGYDEVKGNSLNIPEEKYVWYCLLDDVLFYILPSEYRFDSFEQIIQGYIDFLNKAGRDQLETLRVITHNTARFIVQTVSYVEQKDSSSIDGQILQKQLDLINTQAIEHSPTSDSFRDLVNVFNIYWENRDLITSIPLKIRLPEMASLKTALLEIVSVALDKNVSPDAMVSFFRTYSDLLADLNDVQFDWYIKSFPGVRMSLLVELKLIKLIDNKWANADNGTYSVEAVEKFIKTVPVLFEDYPYPKHYVLEILLTLISYIKNQLQKITWNSGDQLSEMVQISTTNELIFAVRNSFLYFKEQPDYVSFEMFFDERIKPFISAVQNSSSHRDFTSRIYLIKESFWYIRKQNEMDIDEVLELFADLNEGLETEVLHSAYQKYSAAFQQFMEMSCDVSGYIAKSTHIANKVKEKTFVKPHQTWNSHDKLEKIPEILAGLVALWSILVPKDVSSTGKYLTPHCIQILCILRMLSADRTVNGIIGHLTQVLTGQGKSLVLGLTAALLALTGHRPRIVCYNEYLMERDRQDFEDFISMFDLSDSIIYSTFETMADELIAPVVNGERMELRNLVEQMVLGNEQTNQNELVAEDMRQSVLLIDEVDVFFTSQFYGTQTLLPAKVLL